MYKSMFKSFPYCLFFFAFASFCILNSHLDALHIETEFYPAGKIPKEYDKNQGDCTVIKLEDLPSGTITVFETKFTFPSKKELGKLKVENGMVTLVIFSRGYVPGDPVTYEFKHSNKELKQEVILTPYPIYAKSSLDDATISAKLSILHPTTYLIELDNFGKNEKLLVTSISYDERMESPLIVNKKGNITTMPGVVNKKGGVAIMTFTRTSGESFKLELPWGFEWVRYLFFLDTDGELKSVLEKKEFLKENKEIAKFFQQQLNS